MAKLLPPAGKQSVEILRAAAPPGKEGLSRPAFRSGIGVALVGGTESGSPFAGAAAGEP